MWSWPLKYSDLENILNTASSQMPLNGLAYDFSSALELQYICVF